MIDTEVVLEALNALCNDAVASVHRQRAEDGSLTADTSGAAAQLQESMRELSIQDLIPITLCGLRTRFQSPGGTVKVEPICRVNLPQDINEDKETGQIILEPNNYPWSKEHLDPGFNYDFSKLKDTEKYYRGGELYERPCGWQRFALKVLDKYEDNTWLGNRWRTTQSVAGEWPVSYHGTKQEFVKAIIEEHLKAGKRKKHGKGIYLTPDIDIAKRFATKFTSKKTGKKYKVILQNRINPVYREIYKEDNYWLVPIPENASDKEQQEIVEKAIRPYGLLLQEI
ncbi:uncharacterized protein LOC125886760 [Epinephelus fuscoguttatus]|uniref:uncharacterized protein LOC125886760 n=1 Tax=Epinephelus fuscoguttatus TaxID=293821 RepID=UPI0020D0DCF1|nr:uncharacterized protein LOC125886760 [Epinephelus fuscoguttatus]